MLHSVRCRSRRRTGLGGAPETRRNVRVGSRRQSSADAGPGADPTPPRPPTTCLPRIFRLRASAAHIAPSESPVLGTRRVRNAHRGCKPPGDDAAPVFIGAMRPRRMRAVSATSSVSSRTLDLEWGRRHPNYAIESGNSHGAQPGAYSCRKESAQRIPLALRAPEDGQSLTPCIGDGPMRFLCPRRWP